MINKNTDTKTIIIGLCLILACVFSSLILGNALLGFKKLDRSVIVKGLSEREYPADTIIWPVGFVEASNDLITLYNTLEKKKTQITNFLITKGVDINDISFSHPNIEDKKATSYNNGVVEFRYIAQQYITVRSTNVSFIRQLMTELPELGKQGIAFLNNRYDNPTQYIFSKLNTIKPAMIEESTKNARQSALKFAQDSQSKLGKIKQASQGQFTINNRDINNPHIKIIRVVSTVEYYLSD